MSLFRKKKLEDVAPSAFDLVPRESRDQMVSDVIGMTRTVLSWVKLIPVEARKMIADECIALCRTAGVKLVGGMVNPLSSDTDPGSALKGMHIPPALLEMFLAVKVGLTDKPEVPAKPDLPQLTPEEPADGPPTE